MFNTALDVLHRVITLGKETKGIRFGKKKVKLCLFSNNMIIHVKMFENLQKRPARIKVNKVIGYKVNVKKNISVVFIMLMNG